LDHLGLTCVVYVVFRAITCTITEVASVIVKASNKEESVCACVSCVCDSNLYETEESNSTPHIRLALYCPVFEEMNLPLSTVAYFLCLRVLKLPLLL
jgi:hypothetical protein